MSAPSRARREVPLRGFRVAALALALLLVGLGLLAGAISLRKAGCPAAGAGLSCAPIVRPSLSSLGPVPVVAVLLVGGLAEVLAAALLLARGARLPFARDAALAASAGAGFALGLQPLTLVATGQACPVCVACVLVQLLLAFTLGALAREAGAPARPILAAFAVVLVATGALSVRQGLSVREEDRARRAALRACEREDGRLVLVAREGCPFCEALELETLASPEVLPLVRRAGLLVVAPGDLRARGEVEAPVLLGLSPSGQPLARARGYAPGLDPDLERVLEAASR